MVHIRSLKKEPAKIYPQDKLNSQEHLKKNVKIFLFRSRITGGKSPHDTLIIG